MVPGCSGANCTGGHDVYFDNFVLAANAPFSPNILANGNLNTPGSPAGFTITNTVNDNWEISTASFANDTGVAGHAGMWFRSFQGGNVNISQTVAGTAGQYTFTVQAKAQQGYSGLDPLSMTQSFIELDFLNGSTVIGSQMLDLRNAGLDSTANAGQGAWKLLTLMGTAPAMTTNVRVSAYATGMVNSGIDPQGLFFDDFSLMKTGPGSGAAVPEPGSLILILTGAIGAAVCARRNRPAQAV